MIHVQNPKATIGKYRYRRRLASHPRPHHPNLWQATITDSKNGREVSFTRAELETCQKSALWRTTV